jgi:hypothetical protein
MPKDKYAGSDPDPTPFLFVSPEQKRADQVNTLINSSRVARFFVVQNTKTGKNLSNYHKLYQMSLKYNKTPFGFLV